MQQLGLSGHHACGCLSDYARLCLQRAYGTLFGLLIPRGLGVTTSGNEGNGACCVQVKTVDGAVLWLGSECFQVVSVTQHNDGDVNVGGTRVYCWEGNTNEKNMKFMIASVKEREPSLSSTSRDSLLCHRGRHCSPHTYRGTS